MAITDCIFVGGAYTIFGKGTGATDGDFEWDGTTYAISAVADGSGGKILVTCADFGTDIVVGCLVTITGTTDYDGTHEVTDIISTTQFKVVETWNVTRTGNAESHRTSNWENDSGQGRHIPVNNTNKVILSELANVVPSDYVDATYPHEAGKHWCVCDNTSMDQSAVSLLGLLSTEGYDGGVFGLNSKALGDAAAVTDEGSGVVGIPCTAQPFAIGDYVTIAGTINYNGQFRIVTSHTNDFHIKHEHIAENVQTTQSATARRPLLITVTTAYEIVIKSNCLIYLEADGANDIEKTTFKSTKGYLHLSSDGTRNWDAVWVTEAGTLDVADETEVTKIFTTAAASDAVVILGKDCEEAVSGNSINLDAHAGAITWNSKIGQVFLNGAKITYCQTLDASSQVDADNVLCYGGSFEMYGKGTLKAFEVWAGSIILKGPLDKVIGTGASEDFPVYGGTLDLSQASGRIAFGSGDNVDYQDGEFKPAKRNLWTIA